MTTARSPINHQRALLAAGIALAVVAAVALTMTTSAFGLLVTLGLAVAFGGAMTAGTAFGVALTRHQVRRAVQYEVQRSRASV